MNREEAKEVYNTIKQVRLKLLNTMEVMKTMMNDVYLDIDKSVYNLQKGIERKQCVEKRK
jgi:hypothetical protein